MLNIGPKKKNIHIGFEIPTLVQPKPPLCLRHLPPPLPPPCPAPVGEGRIPAGWGLSPGRTGALSPEGRGHRLTDSLATSDQAASEGERERGRETVIGHNHSAEDETSAHLAEVSSQLRGP